jgi:mRNA interferase RelE/StbE
VQYELLFGSRALKDLWKLDKGSSKRILDKIEAMADNLTGDVKKLTDHRPEYRLRVGDFRVLFDVEDRTIIIHRVMNRREAY